MKNNITKLRLTYLSSKLIFCKCLSLDFEGYFTREHRSSFSCNKIAGEDGGCTTYILYTYPKNPFKYFLWADFFFLSYTRNCQLFQEWVLISSPLPRSSRALRKVLVLTSNKTASILTSGKALPSLTFGRVQLSKIIFCITLLTYNNF